MEYRPQTGFHDQRQSDRKYLRDSSERFCWNWKTALNVKCFNWMQTHDKHTACRQTGWSYFLGINCEMKVFVRLLNQHRCLCWLLTGHKTNQAVNTSLRCIYCCGRNQSRARSKDRFTKCATASRRKSHEFTWRGRSQPCLLLKFTLQNYGFKSTAWPQHLVSGFNKRTTSLGPSWEDQIILYVWWCIITGNRRRRNWR